MAYNRYQYETSPRKLKPEYEPIQKKYPKKSTARKANPKKSKRQKQKRKEHIKTVTYLLIAFSVLFVISYRNSVIDENFKQIKNLKEELATVQKENEQLEVNIESSLNLKNIEEAAKTNLGMAKLDASKTKYINLPRVDYVEPATEEVILQKENNWFEEIVNWISGWIK